MTKSPPTSERLAASFDADVENYENARPAYPAELFAHLSLVAGIGPGSRVLEIGAGPGLATLPLLDLGASVVAVEPGDNMAARLKARTQHRDCTIVHAPFEAAEVHGPFDAAVAATAFHWVDPSIGIRKIAGLLRRDGWLALWWNVHRRSGNDADQNWERAIRPIVERFQTGEELAQQPHGFAVDERRAEITAGDLFEFVDHRRFEWPHTHDAASLRALFASFSDWSTLAEPMRTEVLDGVAAVVDEQFGGSITFRYTTSLFLARRR
jgi:SAM-dependent methyltransferase